MDHHTGQIDDHPDPGSGEDTALTPEAQLHADAAGGHWDRLPKERFGRVVMDQVTRRLNTRGIDARDYDAIRSLALLWIMKRRDGGPKGDDYQSWETYVAAQTKYAQGEYYRRSPDRNRRMAKLGNAVVEDPRSSKSAPRHLKPREPDEHVHGDFAALLVSLLALRQRTMMQYQAALTYHFVDRCSIGEEKSPGPATRNEKRVAAMIQEMADDAGPVAKRIATWRTCGIYGPAAQWVACVAAAYSGDALSDADDALFIEGLTGIWVNANDDCGERMLTALIGDAAPTREQYVTLDDQTGPMDDKEAQSHLISDEQELLQLIRRVLIDPGGASIGAVTRAQIIAARELAGVFDWRASIDTDAYGRLRKAALPQFLPDPLARLLKEAKAQKGEKLEQAYAVLSDRVVALEVAGALTNTPMVELDADHRQAKGWRDLYKNDPERVNRMRVAGYKRLREITKKMLDAQARRPNNA